MAIQYVGGITAFATGTTAATADLTAIAGGIDTQPRTGDVVIVSQVIDNNPNGDATAKLGISGYAELFTPIAVADTFTISFGMYYKVMTATPDTSLSTSTDDVGTGTRGIAVQVYRGVNTANINDVAVQSASGVDTAKPTPPAITPITSGAIIVCGGGSAHNRNLQTYTTSDLSNFITAGLDATRESTIGMGNYSWSSGTFTPAQWGFSGSDSISYSWVAGTIALKPSVAAGPANLKSYNTNLKANIKTINTNPIANVKTLNTNV